MFCLKCGREIDDDAMKCPFCNCPTENSGIAVDSNVIDPTLTEGSGKGVAGIILGAVSMLFAWLFALIGWICAGVGLGLSITGLIKNKSNTKCKVGIILSSLGLVCSFISSLIGVLLMM